MTIEDDALKVIRTWKPAPTYLIRNFLKDKYRDITCRQVRTMLQKMCLEGKLEVGRGTRLNQVEWVEATPET